MSLNNSLSTIKANILHFLSRIIYSYETQIRTLHTSSGAVYRFKQIIRRNRFNRNVKVTIAHIENVTFEENQ